MLDAGTGMFRARQRLVRPHLDILLTHAHLDHIVGLSFVLGWRELNGLESIHVYGLPEKIGPIQEHIFSPHIFPIMPPIQWRALPEGQAEFELHCGARVRWWDQTHPGGSIGYRIDYGTHSLAYVTDTTAQKTDRYISQLCDVELLVHECNFDDDQQEMAILTGHSWLSEVLDRAEMCRVGKLALVHTSPYGNIQEPIPLSELASYRGLVVVPNDLDELEF
jgi:ribonuclease Z